MDLFRSQMLGFMANYDVIICPTNANVAIKHDTEYEHLAGFSYTATYSSAKKTYSAAGKMMNLNFTVDLDPLYRL